ncbi:MAG: hypothetical protein QOJ71_1910, partial [Actinomycetota bacterium]|nr:hypothetical protein [Actinomycetota bacterium]
MTALDVRPDTDTAIDAARELLRYLGVDVDTPDLADTP